MTRLVAIAFVWFGCAVAWMVLGSTIVVRSGESSSALTQEVHALWGPPMRQHPPSASYQTTSRVKDVVTSYDNQGRQVQTPIEKDVVVSHPVPLEESDIATTLALEHRRKGLVWFPTYAVDFRSRYVFQNPDGLARSVELVFPLVYGNAGYDGFEVTDADGKPVETTVSSGSASWRVSFGPREKKAFSIRWRSRGTATFHYEMTAATGQVKNFKLVMDTDFRAIDFPAGSVSPSMHGPVSGGGWHGEWQFKNLIASSPIGIDLPQRLNPGPVASRITFFAPVGLLFFFFVVAVFAAGRKKELHPLHYFFLGCAFFAFHLLFAYLVDHFAIWPSFAAASAVSIFLVVSYARLFVGWVFALREIAISQVLYLVLFSATFFWKGYTGLAITVGAILTLFVMMQFTGRVKWDSVAPTPAPPKAPRPDIPVGGARDEAGA